ncbi:uncharacterized protein LOC125869624 [Solanum stenotomum]|uniref:uncharacterized protein LOC125869624 n=1 Tax=Solanum stenotomum TaxID=172797 RepID=UPI0020D127DF|nr:uncharacterized protein LOC125869624 [Solanum stenotomum]
MKYIADNLTVAAQPLSEKDLTLYILGGLGPDYDALVVSITYRVEIISLADLHGFLLSHETRLENLSTIEQKQVHFTAKSSNFNPKSDDGYKKNTNPNLNQHYGGRWGRGRGVVAGFIIILIKSMHAQTQMTAYIAQPNVVSDPSWYPDSSATYHLTNDHLNNLALRGDYHGTYQILDRSGNEEGATVRPGDLSMAFTSFFSPEDPTGSP